VRTKNKKKRNKKMKPKISRGREGDFLHDRTILYYCIVELWSLPSRMARHPWIETPCRRPAELLHMARRPGRTPRMRPSVENHGPIAVRHRVGDERNEKGVPPELCDLATKNMMTALFSFIQTGFASGKFLFPIRPPLF
jgi:hypothetical protein